MENRGIAIAGIEVKKGHSLGEEGEENQVLELLLGNMGIRTCRGH